MKKWWDRRSGTLGRLRIYLSKFELIQRRTLIVIFTVTLQV